MLIVVVVRLVDWLLIVVVVGLVDWLLIMVVARLVNWWLELMVKRFLGVGKRNCILPSLLRLLYFSPNCLKLVII